MTPTWALVLLSACAAASPVTAPANSARPSDSEGVAAVTRVLRDGGELFFLYFDEECRRWVAHPDQRELLYDYTIHIDAECSRSFREELVYSLTNAELTFTSANSYPVSEQGCGHNELHRGLPTECNLGLTPLVDAGGGAVGYRKRALIFVDEPTCRAATKRVRTLERDGMCRK